MMKNRVLAAIATATALALLGTACSSDKGGGTTGPDASAQGSGSNGGNGGNGAQSNTPDPCKLLTFDEISAAVGETFTISKELPPDGLPGQRTCSFEESADAMGTVSMGVWPYDKAKLDSFRAQAGTVTDFNGIGEVAFGGPQSIWVYQGGWMINIALFFVQAGSTQPVTTLAKAAVGRLS